LLAIMLKKRLRKLGSGGKIRASLKVWRMAVA
jgi:hypothetical protein